MLSRVCILALLAGLISCRGCEDAPKPADAGSGQRDRADATTSASASATSTASVATGEDAATLSPALSPALAYGDAGASACRLAYGPAEQPFRGPAVLAVTARELQVIANDTGKPRIYPVPIDPPPAKGKPPVMPSPSRPASFVAMRWPPCDIAGRFVYCQGGGGVIVRTTLGAADGKTVSKSKPGTRFAAATLGAAADHSVVAFLDSRMTSEGNMLQAFVALDDQAPMRLSDEGAGATAVRFVARDKAPAVVAVYIDARTAMVPVHARSVARSEAKGELALGPDVVVFVGGPPERGVEFTAAPIASGSANRTKGFALLPIPRETLDFGVAAIPIEDPPKEDVPAVWSLYPNGIDPAPIAAAPARDGKSAWVVRVRPREKAPGSPKILELGRLDAAGTFASLGEIGENGKPAAVTDAALVEDASGAVWIAYGDSRATWLERRVCD